jgi:hypothetical protein
MARLDEDDEKLQTLSRAKINWNATDADISLFCTCGQESWILGEYARFFKCTCGRAYALGRFVNVLELDEKEIAVVNETAIWVESI